MRRDTVLFRMAALAAISSLSAAALPAVAAAQAPPDAAEAGPEVNPPALVGALVGMSGSVSFHAAGADQWSAAALNYPVTDGEGLWTQPDARARISIGDAVLEMAGGTDLEVYTLDPTGLVATLPEGELFLRIRSLFPGQTLTIVTPRGAVTIATPGQYDISAGTTDTPTIVASIAGAAMLGDGAAGGVTAGQAATITGDVAPFQVAVGPLQQTAFMTAMLQQQQSPPPAPAAAPPPLVADMPGGEELSQYGTWSQAPTYGAVWYPQVASDWVPYRDGHWVWVAPWGWTWVDSDNWGFAPFHYGRWARIDGRWGWCPGEYEAAAAPAYPVYAPALVTFFGVGAAVGVTAALLSTGHVGWVPLAPGEPYRPWFHAAPTYVRNVNLRQVTNINTVINNTTINRITVNNYRNAAAATVVPAAAMATSRPIRSVARAADPQVLRAARPLVGRQPVPPTTATVGVTPRVTRTVHVVPPPAGVHVPERRAAPGPAIRPVQPATARPAAGAARPVAPALVRPGASGAPPAGVHPAQAPAPQGPAHPTRPSPFTEPRPAPPREAAPATRPGAPVTERHAAPAESVHPAAPAARPAPEVHAAPAPRPSPEAHTAPRPPPVHAAPAPRPAPEVRAAPAPRPAPQVHAAPAPRPAPQIHAAPTPRPVPQVHAAPAPRPAPEIRAAPAPRPVPQVHAAPAPRPAPEFHPAPAPRPAPAYHPAPAPAARPAPRQEKRPGEH